MGICALLQYTAIKTVNHVGLVCYFFKKFKEDRSEIIATRAIKWIQVIQS
jgi:hypothetical protein